jgi:RHS repeat-associated protein
LKYEIFRKFVSGTLNKQIETVHISEGKQKICIVDRTNTTLIHRFQITNHLGSSCIELDFGGNIISFEEYHPFGTTSYRSGRNEAEVSLKRYKYVMKELDNERRSPLEHLNLKLKKSEKTGLYYYGMRYYAPWLGRFVSSDPLQIKYPYYTPYQYAGNQPITFIDLDGAEPVMAKSFWDTVWEGANEGINYAKEVRNSVLGLGVGVLATMSEIPGQMHYGDKVPEENQSEVFPNTTGQDFLSLAVGAVAAPVIATGELIKDPTSPERMGEFLAVASITAIPFIKGKSNYFSTSTKNSIIQRIEIKYPFDEFPTDGKSFGNVTIIEGKVNVNGKTANFIDTDFIVDLDGNLKIGNKHVYLSGGVDVQLAGRMKIVNGQIKRIDNLT